MAHIQIILIEKIMVTSGWGGFYLIVFSDKPIWRSEIVGEVLRSYNIYIDEIVGIGRSLRSFVLFVRSLFSTYCRPSR